MSGKTERHCGQAVISAYVTGGGTLPAGTEWALEEHLENCALCRQRVADEVSAHSPAVATLLDGVWAEVDAKAVGRPAPAPSRWLRTVRRWAPPSQQPWLLMGVLVILAALGIDLLAKGGHAPSLVLLVSPVVPLLGVSAAWTRRLDPMGELAVSTPRAGLPLVLRRTTVALLVVIPVLAVAEGVTGVSPALCLLPCLAFTVGALALGSVLGVRRAATVLGTAWVFAVIVPSLLTARLPLLLAPPSLPFWGLAAGVAAVATALRARAFGTLPGAELP
ncbi:zf-HC2 domain-containing protein [Amycolatopsis rhizosphaerae]|uniref:Zf-HC2 domain-containing protein n=1 Tax=Amycolatopsis rhizosphaerae TaxID=2053003 RepID=A0A558BWG0_9PSEU|nr:zf-HC2 domain-containing protein [Amycolatopsis rhizosphaerae]TVT40793.1 zf-HC2 domain-containing protein [Amycolatopsis rhizosphaerae]